MTPSYITATARRLTQCILVCITLIGGVVTADAQSADAHSPGRHFDHVIIVVMENEGTRQALADPNIAALVKGGAWFSNYHALAHPSQPNYLALVGGSTFGIDHDHTPAPIKRPSIVSRL